MRKCFIITILFPTLIALSGCGPSQEKEVVEEKPRTVRVEKIESRDLPILVDAVGRLIPNREVVISSQVSGILLAYNADVGTEVAAGDSLLKLDPTDYELALNEVVANLLSAQARLAASQNAYERARILVPQNLITRELFEKSEAEYKAAQALVMQLEAAVETAQRRLDKTVIRAPFDGFVAQRFVELGQNIAIGEPVMTVIDLKRVRVRIHLNERSYVHLDKTDSVSVKIDAFSSTSFPGQVDKLGIKADPRTNTFEVEILVDNPGMILKAGLTARVSIRTEVIHEALMIPQDCILFREKGKVVFIVEKGDRAATRRVKLGRVNGSAVQILEGIAPGDNLVITGVQYLMPGDKVVIVP